MQRADWQQYILERFDAFLDDEGEPPDIGDFGFYHDEDDVFEVCNMLLLSEFHVLPDAGGWLDQDETWAHDIMQWLGIRARLKWERDPSERGGKRRRSLLDELAGSGASEWGNMLGE